MARYAMLLSLWLAAAHATAEPGGEALFSSLDANGDGFIAYQEAWADDRVERRFRLHDADLSGRLDRTEFVQLLIAAERSSASRSRSG